MPGTISVRVIGARELPIMDRAADTTDAFVEIMFGDKVQKTEIAQKTLQPSWQHEVFEFEAEDQELQNESLVFRVMDYDTYSANDPIGRVYVNLNPMIEAAYLKHVGPTRSSQRAADNSAPMNSFSAHFTGWLPIIDTLHGHRGDLSLDISLELLHDANLLRQASCGVTFSVGSQPPPGTELVAIHGLVDDIISCGDPEYQWMDRIRTPRATNDNRQMKLLDTASQMRRRIGCKAIEMGANAVLGYHITFDLEGESTGVMCVRARGTAVTLQHNTREALGGCNGSVAASVCPSERVRRSRSRSESRDVMIVSDEAVNLTSIQGPGAEHRYSRDSVPISQQSRGLKAMYAEVPQASFSASMGAAAEGSSWDAMFRQYDMATTRPNPCQQQVPLLTLDALPCHMVASHGGVVCARSVKVLTEGTADKEGKKCYSDAAEARAAWWNELRSEVLSHMKSLNCNYVLAYTEDITIDDEVCIMSAMGSAVCCSVPYTSEEQEAGLCAPCHLPYAETQLPFTATAAPCSLCCESRVCEFLLSSAAVEQFSACADGPALPVQTHVMHHMDFKSDEADEAQEISQLLPFLEHQIHERLLSEYLMGGLGDAVNALVGLRVLLVIAQTSVMAIINAYALHLTPLAHKQTIQQQSAASTSRSDSVRPVDLAAEKNAVCVVLHPEAAAQQTHKTALKLRNSLSSARSSSLGPANEATTNGQMSSTASAKDRMSLLFSAALRKNFSHRDIFSTVSVDQTELNALAGSKLEIKCWQEIPQAVVGVAHKTHSSVPSTPGTQPNAPFNGTDKASTKSQKSKINRLVNKFRRRHIEDRQDFESALLLRELAITVGLIQKNTNSVCNEMAVVPSVLGSHQPRSHSQCGVVLTDAVSAAALSNSQPGHVFIAADGTRCFDELNATCELIGSYEASFIRETSALKDKADIDCFLQLVLDEIWSDLSAHVSAYGANCLLNVRLTSSELFGAAAKNQAQCLIGLAGDMYYCACN